MPKYLCKAAINAYIALTKAGLFVYWVACKKGIIDETNISTIEP